MFGLCGHPQSRGRPLYRLARLLQGFDNQEAICVAARRRHCTDGGDSCSLCTKSAWSVNTTLVQSVCSLDEHCINSLRPSRYPSLALSFSLKHETTHSRMIFWLLVSEPEFLGSGQEIPEEIRFWVDLGCQEVCWRVNSVMEIDLGIRMAGH